MNIFPMKSFIRNEISYSNYDLNKIILRMFDIFSTSILLLFIFPFLFLVAIIIKLDSKGPVVFIQQRVGINGRLFNMFKFRTMYHNVDQSLHKKQIQAYAKGNLDLNKGAKLKNDSRITRVGKFLRTFSIDEFPQLFNVIKGDMSLVGPRPVPIYEVEQYDLWHNERLTVLPGVTGLWQISGRSHVSFDEQLRMDIQYVRNRSLKLNIIILLRTIPAVLSRRGAG